jgi:hypothetical protein
MQVPAIRRNRRLVFFEELLEQRLLGERVHQFHRRDHVLGLDHAPAAAGQAAGAR